MRRSKVNFLGGLAGLGLVAGAFAVAPSAHAAAPGGFATGSSALAAPASAPSAGVIKYRFDDGVLYVQGDAADNGVTLVRGYNDKIAISTDSRVVRSGGTPTVANTDQIRISMGAGDDRVKIDGGLPDVVMQLGDGDDSGSGGLGDDVIRGGAGDDTLNGHTGDDLLKGDAGHDTLLGGDGVGLRMHGDAGNDWIRLGNGIARGGTGNDTYNANFDADSVLVEEPGEGQDLVHLDPGELGNEVAGTTFTLGSTATQDVANLGQLSIRLRLNSAETFERVLGGEGDDVLSGNGLPNHINGGLGDDQLTGGGGADRFFAGENEGLWVGHLRKAVQESFGNDTLTDFGDDDVVRIPPSGVVTGGLGTSTVNIEADLDIGTVTAAGFTFAADDIQN